jgi:IPT/TIG domain-containing protein
MKLFLVLVLAAIGVGCGYSKPANMPTQPGTMPTIAQLSPPSTAAGSSNFSLEVDGTNFGSAAVVNFNGTPMSTTFASATKVMASVPATAVMNAGTVPVTVTNPGTPGGIYGGGTAAATSAPMNFTIN